MLHITSSTSARRAAIIVGALALTSLTVACSDDSNTTEPTAAPATTAVDSVVDTTEGAADTAGAEIVSRMAYEGVEVEFTDDELACIDEVWDGVDLDAIGNGFDPFGEYVDDDVMGRAGRMLDECLGDESRVALIAASFSNAGLGADDEQAVCVATAIDEIVLGTATYEEVLTEDVDISDELPTALDNCGVDMSGDQSADECEAEQRTIETAIEAYYAANGTDAEGWDDLVPDYLTAAPTDRWELTFDSDGIPTITGIGACEGYGA